MKLAKSLTTVTPFSKLLAMFLFVAFPFVGFYLGVSYGRSAAILRYPQQTETNASVSPSSNIEKIYIFIKDGTSNQQINKLADDLKSTKGVINVKVVTKEEALAIYKERNKNEPMLLKSITSDLFPASIEASVNSSSDAAIVATAKSQTIVSNVISK